MPHTPFIIADLDGTLLHDAERFEDRALSARTIETVHAVRSRGIPVVVATARPVSTGLSIVQALHADACIYLNGALIDFDPHNQITHHSPDTSHRHRAALSKTDSTRSAPARCAARC